jgi:ubiquinone/menaquinone biosynthesis C-methylase UbiE
MGPMSTTLRSYDRHATRYQRHWAPVLAPTSHRLLEMADSTAREPSKPRRVLDIGTGTGVLAIEAARRWSGARIDAVDGSTGMLEVARRAVESSLAPDAAGRITFGVAVADRLPFDDATFDLAVSSFVFQLVPDRLRALREAHRVIRPGGRLAYVTWILDDTPFAPDEPVDRALEEAGLLDADDGDPEPEEARSGDVVSARAAAAQMRRAGFRPVQAREAVLEHHWTAAGFLRFVAEYDQPDLFEEMDRSTRKAVLRRAGELLAELPPASLVWRTPVVYVIGTRPA